VVLLHVLREISTPLHLVHVVEKEKKSRVNKRWVCGGKAAVPLVGWNWEFELQDTKKLANTVDGVFDFLSPDLIGLIW
jgi:hypothetical protein